MRRILFTVLSVAAVSAAGIGLAAAASALPAFGTDPVQTPHPGTAPVPVTSVTVGHHNGFDRLVFTFGGAVPGYSVQYVPEIIQDGSGKPIPMEGNAFVSVVLQPTATGAPQGTQTPRFPMLRQVKGAGDFEAVASYGVGLASKSGFRVFTLTSPNRLVIDFAIPASAVSSPAGDQSGSQPATDQAGAGSRSDAGTSGTSGTDNGSAGSSGGSGSLPNTGVPVGLLLAGAAVLVAGGVICMRSLHRRLS